MKNNPRNRSKSFPLFLKGLGVIGCLLLMFFEFQVSFGQSNLTAGFTKKEILFLKWGTGNNEVGLLKRKKSYPGEKDRFSTARSFELDDHENIYVMDTCNKRVQIFSSNGKFLRSVPCLDTKPENMRVGEDGEIYLSKISKDPKEEVIVRISKENKRTEYKIKGHADHISGKTVYSWDEKPLLEISEKNNQENGKPRKPYFAPNQEIVTDYSKNPTVAIKFKKINAYLKSLGKTGNFRDLRVPMPQRKFLNTTSRILGVNKNGDVYVGYAFDSRDGLQEQYIQVYSPDGLSKKKLSLSLDELNPDLAAPFRVRMNEDADVYQMRTSKDGVHIYKWESTEDSKK